METEPTGERRQQLAFEYLRAQARSAHIEGDGLLVNLLCHVGLQRVDELTKGNNLLVQFSEIAWMPILAFYWLVNPSERYPIEQFLKAVKSRGDEDRVVRQWIDRYRILIEQPLAGDTNLSPALKDFPWPNAFLEHSPEASALISHLVELTWFHGPDGQHWKPLIETWTRAAPSWTHPMLRELRTRLEFQSHLTSPGLPHEMLDDGAGERLHAHYDLAELWLLHLQGQSVAVCEKAERLSLSLSAETHRWRVLRDFIHIDASFGPQEDFQGVWLARRRRLSVETPLLIFNDKREERLTETLGELFRARSKSEASKRWDIHLLAQLHELSALRTWDYGMWQEATRAQAQTYLEIVQWEDNQPGFSAHGILLSVRSHCVKDPDKDAVTRRAIDTLEFAPAEVLSSLANGLLATYPRQKHQAFQILEDLLDLLPPASWPALAKWTISYVHESAEGRTGGSTLGPARHWLWVLPALPSDSPVWATLHPEALGMANSGICWQGEPAYFLRRWLLCAPLSIAREVAEAMAAHPETDPSVCFGRTEMLIEFEELNPAFHSSYTRRLLPGERSASEALVLAKHLKEADLAAREETLRERITQKVRETITQATSQSDITPFGFSPAPGLHLVDQWRAEDRPLLEELVAAVNSPMVLAEYLPWLLQTIQLLVAKGPAEFATIIQPYVVEWTRHLPRGRIRSGGMSGPLSVMQFSFEMEGEAALMLGWLAFQLPQKLNPELHATVLSWARQMLVTGETRSLELAIYASVVVALESIDILPSEPLALMETAVLCLSSRMEFDKKAVGCLAGALNKISSFIGSKATAAGNPERSPSPVDYIVAILARFLPSFAKSPRASLRAAVAVLVCQLKASGRQEAWVNELLQAFQNDRRARVRFEAEGGWKITRARASGRVDG